MKIGVHVDSKDIRYKDKLAIFSVIKLLKASYKAKLGIFSDIKLPQRRGVFVIILYQ